MASALSGLASRLGVQPARSLLLGGRSPTPSAAARNRGGASTSMAGGGNGGGRPRGRPATAQGDGKGGGGGSGGGDSGLWGAYNRALVRSPLLTKAVTSALISAVGNVFCQLAVERKPELDARRLGVFTALGFAWVAPALHVWFGLVNRWVPAAGNVGALQRMALDQFAWAPVFIASIIALLSLADGRGAAGARDALRADWWPSITANWKLWVPAQFVNFRYVAPQHQLLFANLTSLAWNVWFSFLTRPKAAKAAA